MSESGRELSSRELEVLSKVVAGATNRQVAVELDISPNTVKVHVSNILAKLGAQSRAEATRIALERGLVGHGAAETERESRPRPPEVTWPAPVAPVVGLLVGLALMLLALLAAPALRAGKRSTEGLLLDAAGQPTQGGETHASRWEALLDMPTARARFAQVAVDGAIYAIGGQTATGPTAVVEIYYPELDLWGRGAAKPTAVANVAAAEIGGLVFVPGGLTAAGGLTDQLEIYNPQLDAWAQAAPLPVPLCSYALTAWGQGLYLFGGWDGNAYVDTVLYYDTTTDQWRHAGRLTSPRGFAAAAAIGQRIYVVGGYDGAAELALCESFEPQRAQAGEIAWQRQADMSVGRAGHGLAAVNESLYACGGGWMAPLAASERYDARLDTWVAFESPVTGEWRTLALTPVDRTAGVLLYAIGGWSGEYRSSVYAYHAFYRVYIP